MRVVTEVTHLYKFIPKGVKIPDSDKVRNIPCDSNSIDPKNSVRKAYDNIRLLIDDYAVRNHWKIGFAVSTYSHKGWRTSIRFNDEVSQFGFVDDIETKRENNEVYHVIKTDSDVKFVEKFLNSYYQESKSYHIESVDDGVILYDQWRTSFNNS